MGMDLNGKIAAITGGASGIGLATAEALLDAGATVVLVDRDAAALEKLRERLGPRMIAQVTDLLDPDSCAAKVRRWMSSVRRAASAEVGVIASSA